MVNVEHRLYCENGWVHSESFCYPSYENGWVRTFVGKMLYTQFGERVLLARMDGFAVRLIH